MELLEAQYQPPQTRGLGEVDYPEGPSARGGCDPPYKVNEGVV